MKKRVITAICILAVLIPAVYFGGWLFLIIGTALSVIASYEMMNMFYTKSPTLKNYRYIVPFFSGLLVIAIYFATTKGLSEIIKMDIITKEYVIKNMLYHFWVITIFIASVIICLGSILFKKNSTAHDMLACVMTLTYCGLIMGYVISIEYIEPLSSPTNIEILVRGGRSFAYLFTVVAITDTAAYLIGSKFGRRQLAPEISPKKSVEGGIAGLVAGTIVGTVGMFVFRIIKFVPETSGLMKFLIILAVFAISLVIAFCVQLGDLVASKFKRSYNIKDFGKIFPGHGGVLDRFDSLIFAGAVFYVIVQFIQLALIGVGQ